MALIMTLTAKSKKPLSARGQVFLMKYRRRTTVQRQNTSKVKHFENLEKDLQKPEPYLMDQKHD